MFSPIELRPMSPGNSLQLLCLGWILCAITASAQGQTLDSQSANRDRVAVHEVAPREAPQVPVELMAELENRGKPRLSALHGFDTNAARSIERVNSTTAITTQRNTERQVPPPGLASSPPSATAIPDQLDETEAYHHLADVLLRGLATSELDPKQQTRVLALAFEGVATQARNRALRQPLPGSLGRISERAFGSAKGGVGNQRQPALQAIHQLQQRQAEQLSHLMHEQEQLRGDVQRALSHASERGPQETVAAANAWANVQPLRIPTGGPSSSEHSVMVWDPVRGLQLKPIDQLRMRGDEAGVSDEVRQADYESQIDRELNQLYRQMQWLEQRIEDLQSRRSNPGEHGSQHPLQPMFRPEQPLRPIPRQASQDTR